MQNYLIAAMRLVSNASLEKLKCIRIENGFCTITNGRMTYTSFISEFSHINALVDAKKFNAACAGTGYSPTIKMTNKRLTVLSGGFKARIPLQDPEGFPSIVVRGDTVDLGLETLQTLRILRPFVSTDASRPWAGSILFDKRHAYATNNVVIARVRAVTPRSFNLPIVAYDELIRGVHAITRVSMTDNAVRFDLANNISLHTNLVDAKWPDISSIIVDTNPPPVPDDMLKNVEMIVPLCATASVPRINLRGTGMYTEDGATQGMVEGTSFPSSSFNAIPLQDVLRVCTHIDFSTYPKPCFFKGPAIEGAIVGLR